MTDFGPATAALTAFGLALAASIVAGLMATRPGAAKFAHIPVILAFAAGAGLAGYTLTRMVPGTGPVAAESARLTWFRAGPVVAEFGVRVDPISAAMFAVITGVGTMIALFSAGYMRGSPGFGRYFAVMALFVAAMLLLVLAPNFLLMVAGWEGVGLCSYLLVGYYYAKPSAAAAARKAFLATRLGDALMMLGVFLVWRAGGYNLDFDRVFAHVAAHPEKHAELTVACLLLFCGAVGKSAQVPLYVWLPDAMEGPTPVSALIHAATMVTAGVYLLARCAPLFALAPAAQVVVTVIGGTTALLAGFMAVGQHDLKRVLAYSTVSQLGFMFMALGTGGLVPPSVAVTAALFHLVTHAFFKALLFLGAGSVMHAMGDVIDLRKFGGLRRLMPITHATFLCGALALAGIPVFSGFWSKDQILDTLLEAAEAGQPRSAAYAAVLGVGLVTAGLTAFYTFRAYFLAFRGTERVPEEAGHHAHESPPSMTGPLIVLAVGAVAAGASLGVLTHALSDFLARTPGLILADELAHAGHAAGGHGDPAGFNFGLTGIAAGVALLGLLLAWQVYGAGGPEVVPAGFRGVFAASRHKLYGDEILGAAFVTPAEGLAVAGRQFRRRPRRGGPAGELPAPRRGRAAPAAAQRAGSVLRPRDGPRAGRVFGVRGVRLDPVDPAPQ